MAEKLTRSIAIARNDTRIALRDYFTAVTFVFFPLVLMVLSEKLYEPALIEEGIRTTSGAEQAVPGMSITFALLFIDLVSYAFFREHVWNTWNRLRGSSTTLSEVVIGKVACAFGLLLLQFALVFLGGVVLTGMEVRGSWPAIATVGIAFDLFVISAGLTVAAFSKSLIQASTISYLVVLVLASEAGALVPPSALPDWARVLGPLTPGYWAMDAYREAISTATASVSGPTLRLLILAAVLYLISLRKMRLQEDKLGL
jgi:ABC-2 type transport system permease protein